MNKFIQESFTVSLSSKSPLEKDQNALPVHVLPSPEYPALHAHANDPRVLLHTALTPQLWGVGRTLVDIWENVVKLGVKIRDFAYA